MENPDSAVSSPVRRRRIWLWLIALLGFVVAVPLVSYGTLSPCEMLKKDLRVALVEYLAQEGRSATGSGWEQIGKNLGLTMIFLASGSIVENVVAPLGPLQCLDRVIRLKANPKMMMTDLQKRMEAAQATTTVQARPTVKPKLDWRHELKIKSDGWSRSYGYVKLEGEVQNVGQHTIRSLTMHVFLFDNKDQEIGQERVPIVYSFGDGMRPGHIKPFTMMSKDISGLSKLSYVFDISEYD